MTIAPTVDLDKGGTNRTTKEEYFGPSIGWRRVEVQGTPPPQLNAFYYRSFDDVMTPVALGNNLVFANGVLDALATGGGDVSAVGPPTAGQWAQWTGPTTLAGVDAALTPFVRKAGDTMTGSLTISMADPTIYLNKVTPGAHMNSIFGQVGGVTRWGIFPGDGRVETGGNVGSDFQIQRFSDTGAPIDPVFYVERSTGQITTKNITISQPEPTLILNKQASGTESVIFGALASIKRWALYLGDGAPEAGANAGSNFQIQRHGDNGVVIDSVLNINRQTKQSVLTGNLFINTSNPHLTLLKVNATEEASIVGMYLSNFRWSLYLGDGSPETGGNTGSNFQILRWSDSGALIDSVLSIDRATGLITAAHAISLAASPPVNPNDAVNKAYVDSLIGGGAAPVNAEYITSSANATLTAERVLTNTATITWDFSTPGQAKANTSVGGGNVSTSGTVVVGNYARWASLTTIEARTPAQVLADIGGQAGDPTLTALAAFNTNGFMVQTAADTFTGRTLVAPSAGITITNPAGTAGNPTFALANDLAALEGLTGTNTIYYRSGVDTWAPVTIGANMAFIGGVLSAAAGGGIPDAPGDGVRYLRQNSAWVSGDAAYQPLDADLTSLAAASLTNTIYYRQAANTWNPLNYDSNLSLVSGILSLVDPELKAIAGLTSAADQIPFFTGSGTAGMFTATSFSRGLMANPDAASWRTALGVSGGGDVFKGSANTFTAKNVFTNGFGVAVNEPSGNTTTQGYGFEANAVTNNTLDSVFLGGWNNGTATTPGLVFAKSRGGAIGAHATVQVNDILGIMQWYGSDGSAFRVGAQIYAQVKALPSGGQLPCILNFIVATTAGPQLVAQADLINGFRICGTTVNDNAATGFVGEYVSTSVSSGAPSALPPNTWISCAGIGLSPGDWDVTVNSVVWMQTSSTGGAQIQAGVSVTASASPSVGIQTGIIVTAGDAGFNPCNIGPTRISLAAGTSVYVNVWNNSTGTTTWFGTISARRVR